ncbi:MAG: hypothetical protein GY906_07810 [bacterium]|nr:hypothetical protein [bacterium]
MADDTLRHCLVKVFRDNGFTVPRARALFEEVQTAMEQLLVDEGELRLKGFVRVKVSSQIEKCYNGFTGDSTGKKIVVRAGATVRPRLRDAIVAKYPAKDVDTDVETTRLPSDMTLRTRKLD